jgi:hypothetical protein
MGKRQKTDQMTREQLEHDSSGVEDQENMGAAKDIQTEE